MYRTFRASLWSCDRACASCCDDRSLDELQVEDGDEGYDYGVVGVVVGLEGMEAAAGKLEVGPAVMTVRNAEIYGKQLNVPAEGRGMDCEVG